MIALSTSPRTPGSSRAATIAVLVGIGLAVAKTAYVLSRDAGAIESLVVIVALVIGVVAAVAIAARARPAAAAGMTAPSHWRGRQGVTAALVAGLAVAVAISDAGPAVALRIVVATALAEEILFRGVVYGIAERAGARFAAVVSSVAFGLWHVGDGWADAASDAGTIGRLAVVGAVIGVTGIAGVLVFAPLRRVTGAIYASAIAHAAFNLTGTLLVQAG